MSGPSTSQPSESSTKSSGSLSSLFNLPSSTSAFTKYSEAQHSHTPSTVTPSTYISTHDTSPPSHQVITCGESSVLLRFLYQKKRAKEATKETLSTRKRSSETDEEAFGMVKKGRKDGL